MATRYEVGAYLQQMTTLLELSPERVLRRAGLSAALAQETSISVGAETYFRLWEAMRLEVNRPDLEMFLAMTYAHGPFVPPIFAFSCAETLELGLSRLSDFKPLIGPIKMEVVRNEDTLKVSLLPTVPGLTITPHMGMFELLYITECARVFTGVQVSPLRTTLPAGMEITPENADHLGKTPDITGIVSLTFSAQDAELPLITRSASMWETLEPGLKEQLAEQAGTSTMSGRVKLALSEALPGGSTSIDDMARRLSVSKRSLQRRLSEEGSNYQELLNETRFEMSERYLKDSELSLPEISYLLGFRDTSSFFRAFHGWTGTTPGEFRSTETPPQSEQRPN